MRKKTLFAVGVTRKCPNTPLPTRGREAHPNESFIVVVVAVVDDDDVGDEEEEGFERGDGGEGIEEEDVKEDEEDDEDADKEDDDDGENDDDDDDDDDEAWFERVTGAASQGALATSEGLFTPVNNSTFPVRELTKRTSPLSTEEMNTS